MKTNPDIAFLTTGALNDIKVNDIFNLEDIQRLQDLFCDTHGVASVITHPDGTPITNPTNFCKLCNLIRNTAKGCANCIKSDVVIGRQNSSGPIKQQCLSGGLWDAGASITVGGKHIANWLIGQVRNEEVDERQMIQYADEIGVNRAEFMEALYEVPVISVEQFNKVTKMLFAFANELSEKAYTNWQLKMQIAERKQSELRLKERNEELREKNSFIQTILDNLPIGLALSNFNEGRATYMNNKFEEIYGWTSDDFTSTEAFFEKVYPDEEYRKQITDRTMADINSGDSGRMHWENIHVTRKDGAKRVVNAVNIPLIKQNTMVSTVMDITMLYQIQIDMVKAKEQAQESDHLKTSFLNNISHEIRTPFNGILGFLAILEDNNLTSSERVEYTEIINQSAYRLMNTINDIVEISQIQTEQINLSITETNIRKLISGVYNHFKTDTEKKGLKLFISNDLPPNLDCIYTDSGKLNSILTILMGNAIKFTQAGSIEFGIKLTDNIDKQVQFSVKDTGIGISENKRKVIFDRFVQADVSTTRQFDGSGLGLSIAKAYVEMLDGNIWVDSEVGKGAEFIFTIPDRGKPEEKNALESALLSKATENQNDPEVSGLKILIAEDDEKSAMFLEMVVRIYGKEIIAVKTGVEAVNACRENPDIDLVFMDIKMPEIDGYEATAQIRQFNKDVVIIAQTAYALAGDREKAIEAGCNDYIPKPIRKDQLLMLIQKHLKKLEK